MKNKSDALIYKINFASIILWFLCWIRDFTKGNDRLWNSFQDILDRNWKIQQFKMLTLMIKAFRKVLLLIIKLTVHVSHVKIIYQCTCHTSFHWSCILITIALSLHVILSINSRYIDRLTTNQLYLDIPSLFWSFSLKQG